uniref:Peptidyl-tRNA hydrolase n=1 Tax=candidate division WOR-3 bacterium TaxID=2052148 RepID=A0A7C3J683_UNCW3
MFAFVGLGNPDKIYDRTRHNIGKEIIVEFAKKEKLQFKSGKGHFFFLNVL